MEYRKDRKSFVHKNGIKNYSFDYNKEIRIYLFLCGERMSKREYVKLEKNEKMYTYSEWKSYIRNKCIGCPINGLKEFSRYLNHRGRVYSPEREFISPIASAMVSGIISFFVTEYSDIILGIEITSFIDYTVVVVFILFMCVVVSYFIIQISGMYHKTNIKENFFKDYKEIIDEIIIEKSKTEKTDLTTSIQ